MNGCLYEPLEVQQTLYFQGFSMRGVSFCFTSQFAETGGTGCGLVTYWSQTSHLHSPDGSVEKMQKKPEK
jgi:hypothetical protein